jgi:hypothetical protein
MSERFTQLNPDQGTKVDNDEFIQRFHDMTEVIVKWRNEHGGVVPKEIWLDLLRLSGRYPCVEIIPVDGHGGIYLKVRKDLGAKRGELSWENKLHIPGKSIPAGANYSLSITELINDEILRSDFQQTGNIGLISFPSSNFYQLNLIGLTSQFESERGGVYADTLMYEMVIHESLLQSDFVKMTNRNIESVISQHQQVLGWYEDKNRPFFSTIK